MNLELFTELYQDSGLPLGPLVGGPETGESQPENFHLLLKVLLNDKFN